MATVCETLTVSFKADGNGIHEREGASVLILSTSLFTDDDLVTEDEDDATSLVPVETRARGELIHLCHHCSTHQLTLRNGQPLCIRV